MTDVRQLGLPVRKWVPDWLGVVTVFSVILPVILLNGSYTGSMLEVTYTLGTNSEDITMGYYAASAGMAIAYPIIPKILDAFSSKSLILCDLALQFVLSWVCASSQKSDILIVCSFAIGFLKGFLMLWFIRYARTIFSPRDVRSEFYSYFYPLTYGGGQLSILITAQLAYHYDWKYMYYFMMLLILVSILFVSVCFRHDRPNRSVPLSELHLREMLLVSSGLLMTMYVLTYGKVLDWMSSPRIVAYVAAAPVLLSFFVWYQYHSDRPYVHLTPFRHPKVVVGYLFMMLVMFFSTSTTLLTNFLTTILHVDTTHTYSLYVWLLPGYALGAFVCFWWFRWQRWRFRYLIAGGMSCFAFFFGYLYFMLSPDTAYEMLYLPIFLRGLGMLTLIIAFALFVVEDLNPKYLLMNAFFLITFRSVLAPVLATSVYGNALYRLEQKYMHTLVETVTQVDPLAASRYAASYGSAVAGGHGTDVAAQLATGSLNGVLQQQALLLSLKEMLGILFLIAGVVAVVSCFIPFHKTLRVTFARTGDDMV